MVALTAPGMGNIRTSEREFLARFRELSKERDPEAKILSAIEDALTAETSIRVPGGTGPSGWTYETIPDHPSRIIAGRFWAELLGMTQRGNVSVSVHDSSVRVSVVEQIAELESVGGDWEGALLSLRQQVADALPALPAKPQVADSGAQSRDDGKF